MANTAGQCHALTGCYGQHRRPAARSNWLFYGQHRRLRSTSCMIPEGASVPGTPRTLRKMFEIIACAWHLFDRDGSGCITMDEMEQRLDKNLSHKKKAMDAHKKHWNAPQKGFFTKRRFSEMDTDSNGVVTFSEFLHAFVSWAYDEEEEEK